MIQHLLGEKWFSTYLRWNDSALTWDKMIQHLLEEKWFSTYLRWNDSALTWDEMIQHLLEIKWFSTYLRNRYSALTWGTVIQHWHHEQWFITYFRRYDSALTCGAMIQHLLEEFVIFQNHVHIPLQGVFVEGRPHPGSAPPRVRADVLQRVKAVLFMFGQILLNILPKHWNQISRKWDSVCIIKHTLIIQYDLSQKYR